MSAFWQRILALAGASWALVWTLTLSPPGVAEPDVRGDTARPAESPGRDAASPAESERRDAAQPGRRGDPRADRAGRAAPGRAVYVPPSRGAPGARMGGGTRAFAAALRIAVLAPDHVGLTARAQPSLAWYLSADTQTRVEFALIADGAVEPLVEAPLAGPLGAGVHLVELAEFGVRLEEGVVYDWSVALVRDPNARDADLVAGGAIERRPAGPELPAQVGGGEPAYRVLARHGIWYDAIAELSAAIAAAPADPALRAERAGLLEQVGVGAAAGYDRGRSGPTP